MTELLLWCHHFNRAVLSGALLHFHGIMQNETKCESEVSLRNEGNEALLRSAKLVRACLSVADRTVLKKGFFSRLCNTYQNYTFTVSKCSFEA